MTDLTEFASLSLDELTAELDRMLANHHAPMHAYAARHFSTATHSGQATPLPADTAVRGELIEDRA